MTMNALVDTIPTNKNFLSPLGFRFLVKKLPNVNFFAQKANIPGISMGTTEQPNPFIAIPYYGDHMQFNELEVTFRVDEDMKNYLEINTWIRALAFPEKFSEFAALFKKTPMSGEGLKSDASLIITTNGKNPNYECSFQDIFPISLSDLVFDTTDDSVNYLEATVQFRYTQYKISGL